MSLEDLLRRTMREAIDSAIVVSDDLWNTLCDPNQLESALLNLATNDARAASSPSQQQSTARRHHRGQALAPGFCCVAVTDTGTGMSAEFSAFDAFLPPSRSGSR